MIICFSATFKSCCIFFLQLYIIHHCEQNWPFEILDNFFFVCLMNFFRPSISHGFLLLFFLLILSLGKYLLYISSRCLGNVSKACCVSVALLFSSHLMLLLARQTISLFRELYSLLYAYASFPSFPFAGQYETLESGPINQWWITPVQNDLYQQYYWWIYCQSV